MGSPAGSAHLIRFGEFELDSLTRELRANGNAVGLQDQPFQILLALVERPGELVTRDELKGKLWQSSTFVDFDHSLNTAINRLRRVLDDSADHPRFIESLPRRGYRFVAPVTLDRSPKRTALFEDKSGSNRGFGVAKAVAVTVAASLVIISAINHFRHSTKPTGKYSIVIADFTNTTGDPIFEGTLRQGLEAQLEQSPFFDIISDEQIANSRRLMGQSPEVKLTALAANQICRRNGNSVSIDGSIANFESQYVLGLRAMDCENNRTLAQVQVVAGNRKQVLTALSSAATQLRSQLGESLSTVKKFNTPLDEATTPSIEALQAFTMGRRALWKHQDTNAASFFQRATQFDPNFAMAYAALGMSYENLGETVLAAANTKKAYDLRAHVSEREKLYIESHYLENVLGDLEKARQVYELWEQIYPDDFVPPADLGGIYTQLGQYERALAEDLRAFRVDPLNASNFADRVADYIYLGRLNDAETTAQQAMSNNFDSPKLHTALYVLAFLRNDSAAMADQVSWSSGKTGVEDIFLGLETETSAYRGRFKRADDLCDRAVMSAQKAGDKETAARYEVSSALHNALVGQPMRARQHVTAALELSTGRDVEAEAALALAFIGATYQTRELVSDLDQRFPNDTIVQSNYLPTIRAQLALKSGSAKKAIVALQPAASYEFGDPGELIVAPTVVYPAYVRGQAYLAAGDGTNSVIEFQKILSHPGVVRNRVIGPLAHLGIARAYKVQRDTKMAKAAYQDFLSLWSEADPELPVLRAATSEYNKLK